MKVKEAAGRNFYSVVKIRRDGEELRKKKKNAKVTLSDSFLIDSSLQCHSRVLIKRPRGSRARRLQPDSHTEEQSVFCY